MKSFFSKTLVIVFFLFIVLLVFMFRAGKSPLPDTQKLQVAASFYPLYFFAAELGGDKAEVFNITPAGVEPHDYQPTPGQVARIQNSRIFIRMGNNFESWADKIDTSTIHGQIVTVRADKSLFSETMTEGGEKIVDPHVWLSPRRAIVIVREIYEAYANVDPQNSFYYEANAEALISKLVNVDFKYKQGLQSCQKKDIITAHAAFAYLARDYGLEQVAIAGLSPDDEPSARELARIADFSRQNDVRYIFFENLASPKLAETIATEIGAQVLVLNPIEGLTGEEIKSGKNYFTEMETNLKNLRLALVCE